jgi:hypothetical protein
MAAASCRKPVCALPIARLIFIANANKLAYPKHGWQTPRYVISKTEYGYA